LLHLEAIDEIFFLEQRMRKYRDLIEKNEAGVMRQKSTRLLVPCVHSCGTPLIIAQLHLYCAFGAEHNRR
jgi:hypothetical protein